MNDISKNDSIAVAKVSYILLIVSTLIGISGLIAVIMAYVNKDDSSEWLQTHYRFQIRTFWIGLLYVTVGVFTFTLLIGQLILLFTVIWMIIRCIKGLKQLQNTAPVNNVESWMFG